jgi:hypothetical protein
LALATDTEKSREFNMAEAAWLLQRQADRNAGGTHENNIGKAVFKK